VEGRLLLPEGLHLRLPDRDRGLRRAERRLRRARRAAVWRKDHPDLRDLPFPLLADVSRRFSESLGILEPEEKVCQRATFVVDPEGVIRYAAMNDPSVGRSPAEVLRVLDALQTGELCPCNWKPGEKTLQPA
jgi:alkyl hydroperoxide reductase subunit AhpC